LGVSGGGKLLGGAAREKEEREEGRRLKRWERGKGGKQEQFVNSRNACSREKGLDGVNNLRLGGFFEEERVHRTIWVA